MDQFKKIIVEENDALLSAREAARALSCAPDYVGKLCREQKLSGKQIDGAWYVQESSLVLFEQTRNHAKRARQEALSALRKQERQSQGKAHVPDVPPQPHKQPRHVGVAFVLGSGLLLGSALLAAHVSASAQTRAAADRIVSTFFEAAPAPITLPSIALPARLVASAGFLPNIFGTLAQWFAPAHTALTQNPNSFSTKFSIAPTADAPTATSVSSPGLATTRLNTTPVMEHTTVEHTIEHTTEVAGISEAMVDAKIAALGSSLRDELRVALNGSLSTAVSNSTPSYSYASGGITNSIAASQRIDNLSDVTISNATVHGISGLTAADIPALNYEPLGGGGGGGSGTVSTSTNETAGSLAYFMSNSATPALLGQVATTTLTPSSALSVTGTLGSLVGGSNATLDLNLAHGNWWTALQNFGNASTSQLTATSSVWFTGLGSAGGVGIDSAGKLYAYATTSQTSASSTLLADVNTFSGVNLFTNASSDFSGTWQTFSPSHFQTALGFTPAPNTRAVNTTYPVQGGGDLSADRTLSLAFGTTTSNIWANTQTFTNPIVFSSLASGVLAVNSAGAVYKAATTTLFGSGVDGQVLGLANGVLGFIATSSSGGGTVDFFTHPAAGQSATTSTMLFFNNASTSQLTATSSVWFTGLGSAGGLGLDSAGKLYAYATTSQTSASSTLLADRNTFSGVNLFTNASSDFSGTWQTFSPSHFQVAGSYLTAALTSFGNGYATSTGPAIGIATSTSGNDFSITNSGSTFTFNWPTASASARGLLSAADWSAFNGKQAAGNYITALTGDVTASGPGSAAATLAMGNSHWWTALQNFTNASSSQFTATSSVYLATVGGSVGVGTTSPWAQFAINANTSSTNTTIFAIGSSTATADNTLFTVANNGSTTITNSLTANNGNFFSDSINGTTTIANLATGLLSFDLDAGRVTAFDLPLDSGQAAGTPNSYDFSISGSTVATLYGENNGSGVLQNGRFGIGTSTPGSPFAVTQGITSGQASIAYDGADYTQFSTNAVGNLVVVPSGNNIFFPNTNLFVCTGGTISTSACPTGTPTGQGNVIVQNKIGIASSTPFDSLSIGSVTGSVFGSIAVTENKLATSTSMTIDWTKGNQQLVQTGTAALTIAFSNYIAGQKLNLIICNPGNGAAGTITWPAGISWPGGVAPGQTTTISQCDVWSFMATQATSSVGAVRIFGMQASGFQ